MTGARGHRRWPQVLASTLALVVIMLVALTWWLPARWAWWWMRNDYPAVQVGSVGGTLWHGEMHDLVIDGQHLGALHWTLGRAALFGNVHGSVDLRGAAIVAQGRFERVGDTALVIRNAQVDVTLARLRALVPATAGFDGRLQATVAGARLEGGWPTRLDALVRWQDAAVIDAGRRIALGDWLSRWHAVGGTVVTAQLGDAGTGPVGLHGTFTATVLGWRLDAVLTPRSDSAALQAWLRQVGQPMPNGSVEVAQRGGLMMGPTP